MADELVAREGGLRISSSRVPTATACCSIAPPLDQRVCDAGGATDLVVPPEAEYLKLSNVVIAWKDTREARRAVADALPLLHRAKDVTVVEVVEGAADRAAAQAGVNDVAAWLGRHAVTAVGRVIHASDESDQLDTLWKNGADLVVAGAYGHTRFREWVLGGMTHNLLTRSRRCSFLAH